MDVRFGMVQIFIFISKNCTPSIKEGYTVNSSMTVIKKIWLSIIRINNTSEKCCPTPYLSQHSSNTYFKGVP